MKKSDRNCAYEYLTQLSEEVSKGGYAKKSVIEKRLMFSEIRTRLLGVVFSIHTDKDFDIKDIASDIEMALVNLAELENVVESDRNLMQFVEHIQGGHNK